MSAYNGRLLPRLVFGVPLEAVIFSGISFCCLVILLLPSNYALVIRLALLVVMILFINHARRIIAAGSRIVIIKALREEKRLSKSSTDTMDTGLLK